MSLDVWLTVGGESQPGGSGIFVRENGQRRELTRAEWDAAHPGQEPVVILGGETETVFDANITHNLTTIAAEAGIYTCLWRPDEIGITHARQLIEPLTKGLTALRAEPARYEALNPENGWGSYEAFVPWIERYLDACARYPEAQVRVSR